MKKIAIIFITLFIIFSSLQVYLFFAAHNYSEQFLVDVKKQRVEELSRKGLSDQSITSELDRWELAYRQSQDVPDSLVVPALRMLLTNTAILTVLAIAAYFVFKKKIFFTRVAALVALLVYLIYLTPTFYRTYLVSNSQGLVWYSISGYGREGFNPYKFDGRFINSATAYWLYANTPFTSDSCRYFQPLYASCSFGVLETIVLANWAYQGNSYDFKRSQKVYNMANKMIDKAIKSGADINQHLSEEGLPLFFVPAMENDPDLLNFLLKSGANPRQKISNPDKPNHGQDVFDFLDATTYNSGKEDYTEIKKILRAALSEDSRAQP